MSAILVYVTTGDEAEASQIGRTVLENRLAACANIHKAVTSLYWWEGAVQEDSEAVLILKTRQDLLEDLTHNIIALHSYDCPCVVALPIDGGNPAFLDWIAGETRGSEA